MTMKTLLTPLRGRNVIGIRMSATKEHRHMVAMNAGMIVFFESSYNFLSRLKSATEHKKKYETDDCRQPANQPINQTTDRPAN